MKYLNLYNEISYIGKKIGKSGLNSTINELIEIYSQQNTEDEICEWLYLMDDKNPEYIGFAQRHYHIECLNVIKITKGRYLFNQSPWKNVEDSYRKYYELINSEQTIDLSSNKWMLRIIKEDGKTSSQILISLEKD